LGLLTTGEAFRLTSLEVVVYSIRTVYVLYKKIAASLVLQSNQADRRIKAKAYEYFVSISRAARGVSVDPLIRS